MRYFISTKSGNKREASKQEFIRYERAAGFTRKDDSDSELATGGFTGHDGISGSVNYN